MADHYDWLIRSRTANQRLVRRLLTFVATRRTALEKHDAAAAAFALLTAAAFSLWRAAFLSDIKREWPAILKHAEELLKRLLEDNAINYPQDRNTREWMGSYYLNGARAHLRAARKELDKFTPHEEPEAITALDTLNTRGIRQYTSTKAWDVLHRAASTMFDQLAEALVDSEFPLAARRGPLCKRRQLSTKPRRPSTTDRRPGTRRAGQGNR